MSDPVTHTDILPLYPTDFPTTSVQLVINALRGRDTELKCLAHAAWVLQGFALQQFLPDEHAPLIGKVKEPLVETPLQAAECLEKMLMSMVSYGDAEPVGFDWRGIFSMVLALIQQLLKERKV